MNSLEQILVSYGADYKEISQRFMNNDALYIRILGMLFSDVNLEKLQNDIENDDLVSAFETGHTLKGVSANLGLTPFYNSICNIVEHLRKGEKDVDYKKLCDIIQEEYKKVERLYRQIKELN